MTIEEPIFIVGVGRCGSTIFHEMFSAHPHVSWLSVSLGKFPDKPWINRKLLEAIDNPIFSFFLQDRLSPREAYEFWEYYCKGFTEPCRDLLADDVTNKVKVDIRVACEKIVTQRRHRLLVKITGWPRIGFLREIFPNAKFIHIIRDGRSVVNSMLNVSWWWGWQGPSNWRWGELTPEQHLLWENYNKSFVALAAIEWNILMEAFEAAKKLIVTDDYMEIRYEDLCSDPDDVFRNVMDFSKLEYDGKFEKVLKHYSLENTNYKWKKELTDRQQKMIDEISYKYLKQYGYLS